MYLPFFGGRAHLTHPGSASCWDGIQELVPVALPRDKGQSSSSLGKPLSRLGKITPYPSPFAGLGLTVLSLEHV